MFGSSYQGNLYADYNNLLHLTKRGKLKSPQPNWLAIFPQKWPKHTESNVVIVLISANNLWTMALKHSRIYFDKKTRAHILFLDSAPPRHAWSWREKMKNWLFHCKISWKQSSAAWFWFWILRHHCIHGLWRKIQNSFFHGKNSCSQVFERPQPTFMASLFSLGKMDEKSFKRRSSANRLLKFI